VTTTGRREVRTRPAQWRLRKALRRQAAEAANRLLPLVPLKKPPILVLGAPRSGTSWLAEMLSRADGVLHYDEPCNANINRRDGQREHWTAYARDADVDPYFARHLDPCFAGGFHRSAKWEKGRWRSRISGHGRVLVKEVAAVMLTGWLTRRYLPQVVFIHRHPIAVAHSELRRNGVAGMSGAWLLKNRQLTEDYLPGFEGELTMKRPPLAVAALTWAVRNRVALRQLDSYANVRLVRYEALAADPEAEFRALYADLGLRWTPEVAVAVRESSTETAPGDYSTRRVSNEMVDRWRTLVSEEQAEAVWEAVRPFELPFYDSSEDFSIARTVA